MENQMDSMECQAVLMENQMGSTECRAATMENQMDPMECQTVSWRMFRDNRRDYGIQNFDRR